MTDGSQGQGPTPPGWYPDEQGAMRWWDGQAWTERVAPPHTAPNTASGAGQPFPVPGQPSKPWFKKKRWWVAVAAVIIFGGAAVGGGADDAELDAADSSSASEGAASGQTREVPGEPAGGEVEKPAEEEAAAGKEPEVTPGQANALAAAENYLSFTPFSYKGLIQQLSSPAGDGYSVEDATYAADNVGANWKEQAALAAKNYLDFSPFSRDGLIQQLTSPAGDKFTRAQAEYGVEKAGL